ncbi:pseudouridine synthase [Aquitalea sp. USM4]|uniref:pseudouridine synthase n=1 Tax=Aquitalea sp. USM4 TaxID=1590041 RepID=UPI00103E6BEB|nr:16S rRNA pseudouridine(516) synthase [Aquitalea sp. USM4]QBJ78084.1 16S rRNA pseudouridine(516) synthase [Aquitalea sp. USM4]
MELYRLLQQQGFGSRKECRKLVEYGLVEINGEVAEDYRQEYLPADIEELVVDGEPWPLQDGAIYLLLHKPDGYETSHKPMHHPSVYTLLPWQFGNLGISAVGRLDVDTTGLLLLTNDGQFVHALSSPKRHVPKCYEVTLKHPVLDDLVRHLLAGVFLKDDNEKIAADQVEVVDEITIRMTITQGKYHQVKRMVAAAGNRVMDLHRLSVGSVVLGDLDEGQWRYLEADELASFGFGPDK